jgi:hypothetical protein
MSLEAQKIITRMKEIKELLSEFGLRLSGFDPGVSATFEDKTVRGDGYFGEPIQFNGTEWAWLEPLLIELRDHRKNSYDPY